MKYLWVLAHPERQSLSGALSRHGVAALTAAGHEVRQSDLYAMIWKAVTDAADFPNRDRDERLYCMVASRQAYDSGTQSADVAAE